LGAKGLERPSLGPGIEFLTSPAAGNLFLESLHDARDNPLNIEGVRHFPSPERSGEKPDSLLGSGRQGGGMSGEARLKTPIESADHVQGPANGVVELVEYGDYQDLHSAKAYPVIKRVQRSMNGILKFSFRNFPMAAEAAGVQGRYWQMHDLLFENQEYLDYESLLQYAVELRIDANKFARDFRSPKVERKILADFESGVRSGVNGTPTFFINGYRYDGDWSYYSLMQTLQSVASEAAPV
jgi:hypothetical protein